jgi:hypothetical protein
MLVAARQEGRARNKAGNTEPCKEVFQVILVHVVLHKNQAILRLFLTVMNKKKGVKEITFENGIYTTTYLLQKYHSSSPR